MAFNFIIIFLLLVVTLTIAIVIIRSIRPQNKEDSPTGSWAASIDEKRLYPRVDVNWPVVITTPKGTQNAVIRNIGIGGAFIMCENPLPLDEAASLTFETPLEKPLTLNGKSIWTNISVRDDKIVNKGMRIQFAHNPGKDLKLLHQALIVTSQQTLTDNETPNKTAEYENRRDSRVDVCWPVEMETSRGKIKAETRHVSISGAFILCQVPLPINEKFRITIITSKQNQLSINAEVVWSNANVSDDKVTNRGMGIRFTNNSKDDMEPLAAVLLKVVTTSYSPED